jgi:hypothetical protein
MLNRTVLLPTLRSSPTPAVRHDLELANPTDCGTEGNKQDKAREWKEEALGAEEQADGGG